MGLNQGGDDHMIFSRCSTSGNTMRGSLGRCVTYGEHNFTCCGIEIN